ncbi:unnamed protein product [Ophioblennius macclurei]
MTKDICFCFCALLLALLHPGHREETEVYRVSAHRLFLLRCPGSNASSHVTWSRTEAEGPGLPDGVEVQDGLLWFKPVLLHHNGSYTCKRSGSTIRMTFRLSVSSDSCPEPSEVRSIQNATSGELPCKQEDVFALQGRRTVRWMKDCLPVDQRHLQDDHRGGLRLLAANQGDAGKYTCLVTVSVDGRHYTAARSVQLTIEPAPPYVEPQVVFPQGHVVIVQVGKRAEVKCVAYLGPEDDADEVSKFWTVNGNYIESFDELEESSEIVNKSRKVFWHSTLSISSVPRDFLGVPITCHVQNPLANKEGSAWLREADHSAFHLAISLCLLAAVAAALVVVLFLFFKVELVLAYRNLQTRFPRRQAPDGKLYDAYVSCLHPDSETESFALQVLPGEMEERHGYSLYIPGRDDCPGEAMHDAVSTAVSRCRRLIIVLSSSGESEKAPPTIDRRTQLCYEQEVGLYDALTRNDPRVILVEIGGSVDYSCLPESLRYVRRKHGALTWNNVQLGRRHAERRFWKNLRYRMPPPQPPATSRRTVV